MDFSAWLSEQDLADEEVEYLKGDGTHVLFDLIYDYNNRDEEEKDEETGSDWNYRARQNTSR